MVGNTFNCWLNQAMADDNYCQWLLDNVHNAASTTTSKVMGYTWNLMDTEDERAALMRQAREAAAEYTRTALPESADGAALIARIVLFVLVAAAAALVLWLTGVIG